MVPQLGASAIFVGYNLGPERRLGGEDGVPGPVWMDSESGGAKCRYPWYKTGKTENGSGAGEISGDARGAGRRNGAGRPPRSTG